MKTPKQIVFEATFPSKELDNVPDNWKAKSYSYMPLELEEMVRQAMQQARDEALEEAVSIINRKFPELDDLADDIRALKTKKA